LYNDFVLIGPKSDPAGIKGLKDVAKALKAIKDTPATFISRGDNSGTHLFELKLWNKDVGVNIQEQSGSWYKSIERGMEGTLRIARARDAYVLSDRGTWISFKNRGDLQILLEGDRRMFNQYGVILVNPAKHPNVKQEFGQALSTGWCRQKAKSLLATTRLMASGCFIPTPKIRTHELIGRPCRQCPL
jgi:tungstate transport system substrate-binding protein